jgi:hypothetical protein
MYNIGARESDILALLMTDSFEFLYIDTPRLLALVLTMR